MKTRLTMMQSSFSSTRPHVTVAADTGTAVWLSQRYHHDHAAVTLWSGAGADMTRFPAPAHLASWTGRVPLDRQSGKRAGSARRKRGSRYIGAVTGETATAGKTQTREGARAASSKCPT